MYKRKTELIFEAHCKAFTIQEKLMLSNLIIIRMPNSCTNLCIVLLGTQHSNLDIVSGLRAYRIYAKQNKYYLMNVCPGKSGSTIIPKNWYD